MRARDQSGIAEMGRERGGVKGVGRRGECGKRRRVKSRQSVTVCNALLCAFLSASLPPFPPILLSLPLPPALCDSLPLPLTLPLTPPLTPPLPPPLSPSLTPSCPVTGSSEVGSETERVCTTQLCASVCKSSLKDTSRCTVGLWCHGVESEREGEAGTESEGGRERERRREGKRANEGGRERCEWCNGPRVCANGMCMCKQCVSSISSSGPVLEQSARRLRSHLSLSPSFALSPSLAYPLTLHANQCI